jgi:hypothetical protein
MHTSRSNTEPAVRTRSIVFFLIGAAVFLLRRRYTGPLDDVVHAYAGNVSVSFAVYFYLRFSLAIVDTVNIQLPVRFRKLIAAGVAFAAVELFEAFDGFGVMANTYDPFDFLANLTGIVLAFWLDTKLGTVRTEEVRANPS